MLRTASFALSLILVSLASTLPSRAEQTMCCLDQVGTIGDVKLCFTNDSIRADVPSRNLKILCTAPEWKVVVLNTKKNLIMRIPFSRWTKQGLAWNILPINAITVTKSETTEVSYAGVKAKKMMTTDPHLDFRSDFSLSSATKPARYVKAECIYSPQLVNKNSNITKFISGLYNLPIDRAVPLAYVTYRTDQPHATFYTNSVKSLAVPTAYFAYSGHYTPCSDAWKYLLDDQKQQELTQMGEDLNLGTDFGTKSR